MAAASCRAAEPDTNYNGTADAGNHTAWMVSVVGTIQQRAVRGPTVHSFTTQIHLRPAAEQKQANGVLARMKISCASSRPKHTSTHDPRNEKTASTPDPRASGREVKRAVQMGLQGRGTLHARILELLQHYLKTFFNFENSLLFLQVTRFHKSILLIVQYKYLKSCSEDFILKNLILRTRSCGTVFMNNKVGFFISAGQK